MNHRYFADADDARGVFGTSSSDRAFGEKVIVAGSGEERRAATGEADRNERDPGDGSSRHGETLHDTVEDLRLRGVVWPPDDGARAQSSTGV